MRILLVGLLLMGCTYVAPPGMPSRDERMSRAERLILHQQVAITELRHEVGELRTRLTRLEEGE